MVASLALADTKTVNDPKDAKGDQTGSDLKSVKVAHASGKRLVYTIGFHPTMRKDLAGLQIEIFKGSARGDRTPSHLVQRTSVMNANFKQTGGVKTKIVGANTVRMTFAEKAIGSPKAYKWRACVVFEGPCWATAVDVAPAKPVKHGLG